MWRRPTVVAMPKAIKDPGVNGSEKPRPEPFYSLRKRNERRAQVAQLLERRRRRHHHLLDRSRRPGCRSGCTRARRPETQWPHAVVRGRPEGGEIASQRPLDAVAQIVWVVDVLTHSLDVERRRAIDAAAQ